MSDNGWKLVAQREKAARIASTIEQMCPMSSADAAKMSVGGRRAADHLAAKMTGRKPPRKDISDECWQMVVDRLRENEERDARRTRAVTNSSLMVD